MAINKVIYGTDTLVDLTEDTVAVEDVLNSKSFHTPDGVKRTGIASYPVTDVQVNGTSVMDGTVAKVEQPTADNKTATDQFNTADGGLLSKCMIDLVPVQSGSGDPYPAGGGKNKYSVLVGDDTFTDNVSGTSHSDSDGQLVINMVGSTNSGCYSANGSTFKSVTGGLSGTYTISCDIKASTNMNIRFRVSSSGTDLVDFTATTSWQRKSITLALDSTERMLIFYNQSSTSGTITVKDVQIESGSTATDYAPYSNVRPISGHTEVDLYNVGKNILPLSIATIKSLNTSGTWSENTYTVHGVAYSFEMDSNGNVVNVKAIGTPSNNADLILTITAVGSGSYILNGCPSGGNASTYRVYANWYYSGSNHVFQDVGIGVACNWNYTGGANNFSVMIRIANGTTIPTGGLLFEPMLRLATETDPTYEPYQGKLYTVQIGSTVYGGYVDLVSGVMTVTQKKIILNGTENWDKSGIATISRFILRTIGSLYGVNNKSAICDTFKSIDYDTETTIRDTEIGFLSYSSGMYSDQIAINYSLDPSITKETFKTYLSNNNVEAALPLTTPLTIHLTPQQIETLSGQNNLSTPLDGQSIETNGVEYKELFTFADVKEYVKPLIPYSNAGSHNAIYRGKYLGNHVTPEQWASIVAGTFDDLFIGDYWTINSVNWRIAHFDYWLGTGDTACTDHHVMIVPDTNLYNAKMNSTDITTGGYYNSEMRGGVNYLVSGSSNLYSASETIKSAFGSSHILTHREILTNAVSSGDASGWSWYSSSVELMSEVMVFGTLAWSVGGKGYEVGIDKGQLALFRHNISRATNRASWWLRGVISATYFTRVSDSGDATRSSASASYGVRPCFAIK